MYRESCWTGQVTLQRGSSFRLQHTRRVYKGHRPVFQQFRDAVGFNKNASLQLEYVQRSFYLSTLVCGTNTLLYSWDLQFIDFHIHFGALTAGVCRDTMNTSPNWLKNLQNVTRQWPEKWQKISDNSEKDDKKTLSNYYNYIFWGQISDAVSYLFSWLVSGTPVVENRFPVIKCF